MSQSNALRLAVHRRRGAKTPLAKQGAARPKPVQAIASATSAASVSASSSTASALAP